MNERTTKLFINLMEDWGMEAKTKKELISWIKTIAITVILLFITRTYLFTAVTVNGASMSPTFADSDKVLVNRISKIQHFDMIVFDAPESEKLYIKRVIWLLGGSIEMKNDILYINGEAIGEPYIEENRKEFPLDKLTGDFTLEELTNERTVPEGKLFVMGDNLMHSKDSRIFGFIDEDSLSGEVFFPTFR